MTSGAVARPRLVISRAAEMHLSVDAEPAASDYESDARRMIFLILSWKGHTPRR